MFRSCGASKKEKDAKILHFKNMVEWMKIYSQPYNLVFNLITLSQIKKINPQDEKTFPANYGHLAKTSNFKELTLNVANALKLEANMKMDDETMLGSVNQGVTLQQGKLAYWIRTNLTQDEFSESFPESNSARAMIGFR